MDMFEANPNEDNMMDVEPWLSVPGSSGLDDPAEAMFPDASPAPSLPGELCCPLNRHAIAVLTQCYAACSCAHHIFSVSGLDMLHAIKAM